MTRITAGVKGKEFCDSHLRKERIEIVRIPNEIKSGKAKNFNSPKEFTYGTGHVVFFRNKLKYLEKRYHALTEECVKRGFEVTDFSDSFKDLPSHLYNDWQETPEARNLSIERVSTRLKGMRQKDRKYYSQNKTVLELINLIQ